MAQNDCPKCGRPIQKFNGRIGYCPQHKWVSPQGLGFEAEATEQNRQDKETAENQRLEQERSKQEAERQQIHEQHQAIVRKAAIIMVALCLIAIAIVFFVVRPGVIYDGATEKLIAGNLAESREAYASLGNYKDSTSRVLLCDAMTDLQENRTDNAMTKLDQLISDSAVDAAKQLADAFLPIVVNWKARGLTPQALLLLLKRADIIDANKTLPIEALSLEAHTAMLEGEIISTYTEDVNSDGDNELVALDTNYSVTVYRMSTDGNTRVAVDNNITAACEMRFGSQYTKIDINASVACYSEAYRILPNDATRAALAEIYRQRSTYYEDSGNVLSAIEDARSAMETSGSIEDFSFFYDANLRYCKNGNDGETAISMWEDFANDSSIAIARFGAQNRWKADAAMLHIARSSELASRKDAACIDEIRTAADMGADVTSAIVEAESRFGPGLTLAQLRLLELTNSEGDPDKKHQIYSAMSVEVRSAISEWKIRGIAASDVPMLFHLADVQKIDLSEINRDSVYEEAALAAAGSVTQSVFVDWDADGYKELLTLDSSGKLSLYGFAESWGIISSLNTGLESAIFTIADESAPLILVVSGNKNELLALTCADDNLSALFRETGISRYAANGANISFSRLLAGSITRYNDYAYEAVGLDNRPVRIGIDWQQNDYPQPKTASDALQRYFEARAYNIPDEAALLVTASENDAFTWAELSALAVPDVPGTITALPYQTEDDRMLFEVTYPSGSQSIRTWVETKNNGGWKIVGAASTYGAELNPDSVDFSVPLLSLNEETINVIAQRGNRQTYRLLLPAAGRMYLEWQAGEKTASRTAYNVSLYRGTLAGEAVVSYDLQLNTARQQTKAMFMSAGVYYVTVEAMISEAPTYHLKLLMDAAAHVELESNDTPATATTIELNTEYSGSLLTNKDTDFFSFKLNAASAVNVTLGTAGNGSKTAAYVYTVINAADGTRLSTISVPGNALLAETGNLYLSAGAYLVQLNRESTWVNDEYTLTVKDSLNGTMESESNNTLETANIIPVNEDIHASIGQEGDTDCFTFSLNGDAAVQPRFTFKPTDSSSKTYMLTLLNTNRQELLTVNIGGKESAKVIPPVALTAGTYTVRIENPRFIRQEYTLHLACVDVAFAEKEPNDSAALATDLSIGQARTGVLSSDVDIDYYKLTIVTQTSVVLKYSFPQNTSKNTAYTLTIEQNGKTQWTANIKGDTGGVEQQLEFPAGEYYVKVKPSTWTSAVYTISID